MKFWDSSALVPLLVFETAREKLLDLLESDGELIVWWGAPVECVSAIARRERAGDMELIAANDAIRRLRAIGPTWIEVSPSLQVRNLAERLLRVHTLRAAGSLQLAAALVASERNPEVLGFVCLDDRLSDAARREGFDVLP